MPRVQPGFTLIELMVTLAIAAILLAISVPSFMDTIARQRIEGTANELVADLGYAATESISRNLEVRVSTPDDGSYTIATIDSGGSVVTELKEVTLGAGLSITSPVTVTYEPFRGSANAATFTLSSTGTASTLRISTNAAGRVHICAPGSAFAGYSPCS